MGNTLLAPAVAVVGVVGTLLSPLLSHRVQARTQAQQSAQQERLSDAQWERERRAADLTLRRECSITANSAYRRYRQELMLYLWLVRGDGADAQARAGLDEARRTMNAAFAQAQMIASDEVLEEMDGMSGALVSVYARILRLEDGDPYPDGSFDAIHAQLMALADVWKSMRAAMRTDLGTGA